MAETEKPAAAKKAATKPAATRAKAMTAAPKAVAKAQPAKGKADNVKSKVKSDMHDFKAQATDSVRAAATKGKDRATEAVGSIGKLIRDSAGTIDDNVGKQYGDYARSAADMVDGFAGKMDAKMWIRWQRMRGNSSAKALPSPLVQPPQLVLFWRASYVRAAKTFEYHHSCIAKCRQWPISG